MDKMIVDLDKDQLVEKGLTMNIVEMRNAGALYDDRAPNQNLKENCQELLEDLQITCHEFKKLSLNIDASSNRQSQASLSESGAETSQ